MLKFSSKKILLVFFAIMMFAVFFKFFSILSFTDPEMVLEKGETIKLKARNTLTQKFVANRDNLLKIRFLLSKTGINDGDAVKIQIADENCSDVIREGILVPSFLAVDNLFEFQFDKIPNSNGKTFCIKATFEPQDPKAKAIKFFSKKDDSSSLCIRPAYKNNAWQQDVSELNQRMSQYKPWFLKHFYLYAISTLFILLSFAIVIILILV